MMENLLFSLKSCIATWQSTSPCWVIDIILSVVCGVVFFLVLLPCGESGPGPPPARKQRNIRKRPAKLRWRWQTRIRKRGGALKAHNVGLRGLKETHNLISLLGSHLGTPEKGSYGPCSGQDPPGAVCTTAPEGAHQSCGEPVEDTAPTMAVSSSPPPLTELPRPLASTLPPGPTTSSVSNSSLSVPPPLEPFLPLVSLSPQPLALSHSPSCPPGSEAHAPPPIASLPPPSPDPMLTLPQCGSMALPLAPGPPRSSPPTPRSASPIPAISGLGHSSCPILALSSGQADAKGLCLSTSPLCESQQEHLSHHPPDPLLWGDPTDRQVDAGSSSLLSSDEQKLLEIQYIKKIKIKIWNEKEKDELYVKQMRPDYHLKSWEPMRPSGVAEQGTTTPQPVEHSRQARATSQSHQLLYAKVLGDHVENKYNQLFWGLPSLHSESLVAAVWTSESPCTLHSPFFLFSGTSSACPVQAQVSPLASHSQPLSRLESLSHSMIPTSLQFHSSPLAQVQTQGDLQPSLPALPPSCPPQRGACTLSCPMAQNTPHSLIPTAVQHPERPLLQTPPESGWDLSAAVKRSQEAFNVLTSNPPEDSLVVSTLPENFPISPEFRMQLEQHLQKLLSQHHWELHPNTQESQELRQHQDGLPGAGPAKGHHGPSRPSSISGESSKDTQKVGLQVRQNMGKGLGHILGKVPKDPSRGSESSLMRVRTVETEEPENDLTLLRSDSRSDVLRNLDKNVDNILEGRLGSKLGQMSQSQSPESAHGSWLAVTHSSAKSHTLVETTEVLKAWEPCVNTSHRAPFLHTDTQEVLETHITKLRVQHRWGLALKVLKIVTLIQLKKAPASPILQGGFPPSPTCVSGAHSVVKHAELGKPPQACWRKNMKTEESIPPMARHLLPRSPVSEEIQSVLGETPSGDDHGPSKASLSGQEGRPPSQSLTLTWQSGHMEWDQRGSLDPSPRSAMGRNAPNEKRWGQASQDSCNGVTMLEMNRGFRSLRAKEARETVEARVSFDFKPESKVMLGTNVLTKSQNLNAHVRCLETPGTSKSPLVPRKSALQDPGQPWLIREFVGEYKSKVKVQAENQPQDGPTQMPLAADTVASQVPPCHTQRAPTGDRLSPSEVCGSKLAQRSSLGKQEPRTSTIQDSWKDQNKTMTPTYEREDFKRLHPGEQAEGLEKTRSRSPSAQARGTADSVGRGYLQLGPEKEQGLPESNFRKRMRLFFQWISPHKNIKGQGALQKHKPKAATAQSQGPAKSRPTMDSETAEAPARIRAVGQSLEEKMDIRRGLHTTRLNEHGQEQQVPVRGCFCSHRLPFHLEEGGVMNYMACSHQAHSKDQHCSKGEGQVRHRQSLRSVRFFDKQPGLSLLSSLLPKTTLSPVRCCQHGPQVPGALGHHQHCPRHCPFGAGVLPCQPQNAFLGFPGGNTCLQEKFQPI